MADMDLSKTFQEMAQRYPRMTTVGGGLAGPKNLVELDVARTLVEELRCDDIRQLTEVVRREETSPPTPPDCLARTEQGGLIGIEITELVDGELIVPNIHQRKAANEKLNPGYTRSQKLEACSQHPEMVRVWTFEDLVDRLDQIIVKKDGKEFIEDSEPFAERWLVIHTDEPDLCWEKYRGELAKYRFVTPHQLDAVFLRWSLHPGRERYPYVRLHWA